MSLVSKIYKCIQLLEHVEHIVLGQIIVEDEKEYAGISVEEYNLIKPPKQQKSSSTVMRLKDYIRANGKILLSVA